MRRSRRNGHGGLEFGGSGEDSFVAVVVTKLTGALLFILLLTMVIMALLPKVADLPASGDRAESEEAAAPLAVATPETLPEAIAGHPYVVALAATGGRGPLRWAVDGELPAGLSFDAQSAQIRGTPRAGTSQPASLVLRVGDGSDRAARTTQLVVYESDRPLSTPSKWKPALPPIPWQAWLEQGVGFLILWLVHLVGMNTLGALLRSRLAALPAEGDEAVEEERALRRRFTGYRVLIWLATLGTTAALAAWLIRGH